MNRVRVETLSPSASELLTAQALGAGALIVIQSSAVGGGTGFTEIGTVALVAGVDEYTFYDAAGLPGTFYRTTYDSAARNVAPDYSAEFQVASQDTVVSIAAVRALVKTPLTDDDLADVIARVEAEVVARIGPVGTVVDFVDGYTYRLVLSRPALLITSIVETNSGATSTTLASNDYVLRSPYVLERLTTGTNSAQLWNWRVTVTYTPIDDLLLRQGVVIDLIRLTLTRNPGLTSQQIGDWSESYSTVEDDTEREAILARLAPGPKMRII